ncbi:AMP-dependent synthetase/ligase [Pseudooceanicola aestuarii]|uniref:AMP-dependent synthetase/ligase n=1 Tax=Pseudooceanicola aestuarii TaxID=2697319 RepID=UPI0013D8C116|nr:long-chain fatty acid--CoA ligase [Pseudooceanicola aestuarii]
MALETSQFPSLVHFLRARAGDWQGRPAMRHKDLGIWKTITWDAYYRQVCQAAAACHALGIGPGTASSVLSENRPEWLIADFAAMMCGVMSSGIYPTSSAAQVGYQVSHSGSAILFVEGGEQYEKLQATDPAQLAGLRRIVIFDMDGLDRLEDPRVLPWEDFLAQGAELLARDPGLPDRLLDGLSADHIAILIYTSGTTGDPKGAMISHANMLAQVQAWHESYDTGPRDRSVCFLPLCHVAERSFSAFSPLADGMIIHFVESMSALMENMREVKPTLIFAPPRIFEKVNATLELAVSEARPSSRRVYELARRWMQAATPPAGRVAGARVPPLARIKGAIARHLLLRNVLRLMGMGQVRYAMSGAAPVSPDLIDWYRGLGVNLFELYGMTETSGSQTCLNLDGPHRAAGPCVRLGEMRIGQAEEIQVRGPHVFCGYLNDPENTARTIDPQGWLLTGDQGEIDADGNLKIIGRIKDVMITSGGKNLTPSKIETMIKTSPYVTDAMLIGDGRAYVTALVMIDYEMTARHARDTGLSFTNYADLCRNDKVAELIGTWMEEVNTRLNQVEKVKKFRVIDVELDAEDEELTPTMKLRRAKIEQRYGDVIEAMYAR